MDREHKHGNPAPVVIWVGKTANLARKWLAEQSVIGTDSHAQFAMPWFRVVSNDRFVSVEDVHPSAHLQGGGHLPLRRLFQETYACLEALRRLSPQIDADTLFATMDEDARVRHYEMIGALDALGMPHDNGWLAANVRHLRLVPN